MYVLAAVFWCAVFASLLIITVCFAFVAERSWQNFTVRRGDSLRSNPNASPLRVAPIAFLACCLLLAALPLYALWQVLHPLPVPKVQGPQSNGIEEIAAAGQAFSNSPTLNLLSRGHVLNPPTDALAAEIERYSAAFAHTVDQRRFGDERRRDGAVQGNDRLGELRRPQISDLQRQRVERRLWRPRPAPLR
jgi:hypothetical protein